MLTVPLLARSFGNLLAVKGPEVARKPARSLKPSVREVLRAQFHEAVVIIGILETLKTFHGEGVNEPDK